MFEKSDERIHGYGNFVEQMLSTAEEQMEQRNLLKSKGYDLKMTAKRVCSVMNLEPSEIWKIGKGDSVLPPGVCSAFGQSGSLTAA